MRGSYKFIVALVIGASTAVPVGVLPAQAAPVPLLAQEAGELPGAPQTPEQAALDKASETGEDVEVTSLTTETVRVFAEPGGALRGEVSAAAVRKRSGEGWVALDPELIHDAGVVRPKVVEGDLVLSNGGAAGTVAIAYTGPDGQRFELASPFPLTVPVLSGNFATYPDVLPGVDFVVEVSVSGFSYNWVVKTPAAAQDSRLAEIRMPLDAPGLTALKEEHGFSFRDKRGIERLWSPAPVMWDSSAGPDGSSAKAVGAGPEARDKVAGVDAAVTNAAVIVKPNLELLRNPNAKFPVVIDPALVLSRARNAWTAVWNIYPNTSFWMTGHSLGAGYEGFEQNKVVRSYFKFDVSAFAGKHIIAAEMNIKQIHTASCQARSTQVYRTGSIFSSTTWNQQPARHEYQSSSSSTTGCNGGTGMVGWNVKTGLTTLADMAATQGTFLIRAADEGDEVAWKQFDDDNASIEVYYVSKPVTPQSLRVGGTNTAPITCTPGSTYVFGQTSVTLYGLMDSADGPTQRLRGIFERYDNTAGTLLPQVPSDGDMVPPDTWAQYTWSGLTNGKTYRFRTIARVWWSVNGVGGYLDSTWSSACYFRIDTSKPIPPVATSTALNLWTTDQAAPKGTLNTAAAITLDSPSSDVTKYLWKLNDGPWNTVTTTAGNPQTVTVTPDTELSTLWVKASDSVNESPQGTYYFRVNTPTPAVTWAFDGASLTTNTAPGATGGALTIGSATASSYGRVDKALTLTPTAPAGATSTTTGVSTLNDFTVAAWVRAKSATDMTLVSAVAADSDPFEIGYSAGAQTWVAGRRDPAGALAALSAPGMPGVWTHVAASWNAGPNRLSLYVNGEHIGDKTFTTGNPSNTSGWWLGCGRAGTSTVRCANGKVDEIALYKSVLAPTTIKRLANPLTVDTVPALGLNNVWGMVDATEPVDANDLTLSAPDPVTGAPRFVASDGFWEGLLDLLGAANQSVKTTRPTGDTTGSFTVSACVRLNSTTKDMVIAQQRGGTGAAWTLGVRGGPTGSQWVFQRSTTDTASPAVVEVHSEANMDLVGTMFLVQGVYDASQEDPATPPKLELYVNGVGQSNTNGGVSGVDDPTPPWLARGRLDIGVGTFAGASAPFDGQIDYLDVSAGAIGFRNGAPCYAG